MNTIIKQTRDEYYNLLWEEIKDADMTTGEGKSKIVGMFADEMYSLLRRYITAEESNIEISRKFTEALESIASLIQKMTIDIKENNNIISSELTRLSDILERHKLE